jgi:hypothetical protein
LSVQASSYLLQICSDQLRLLVDRLEEMKGADPILRIVKPRAALYMIVIGYWVLCGPSAGQELTIDLRRVVSHQDLVDGDDFLIASKTFKTRVGSVTITVTRDKGRVSSAVAKVGSQVIARARVLSDSRDGAEIEESQFHAGDPITPVYVGRVRYNSFRDRVVSTTKINGTKTYELFVDWKWERSPR